MGVFSNIYTSKFEEYEQKYNEQSKYDDFNFFNNYYIAVINTFEWKTPKDFNLPRFMIEKFLCESARIAGYVKDDVFRIYPAFPSGSLMDNGEFTHYTIVKPNGETFVLRNDECEICFNNSLKRPSVYDIWNYANKSAFALKAVDSALRKATFPIIVNCNDEAELKMIEDLVNDNSHLIPVKATLKNAYSDNKLNRENVFDNREYDILSLWDVYVRYRNLFYTTYGFNIVEIQKKERLTMAEGSGNDEIVRYSLLSDRLNNRKDFVERCKEHFNVELSVELNRDAQSVYELNADNEDKIMEVKENEVQVE